MEQQLSDLREENTKKLKAKQEAHDADLRKLWDEHKAALEAERKAHEVECDRLKQRRQVEEAELKREEHIKTAELVVEHERHLQLDREKVEAEEREAQAAYERERAAYQAKFLAEQEAAKPAKIDKLVAPIRAKYDAELAETEALEQEVAESSGKKADMTRQHELKVEALDKQFEKLKRDKEAKIRKAHADFAALVEKEKEMAKQHTHERRCQLDAQHQELERIDAKIDAARRKKLKRKEELLAQVDALQRENAERERALEDLRTRRMLSESRDSSGRRRAPAREADEPSRNAAPPGRPEMAFGARRDLGRGLSPRAGDA
ncbi:hypothetical protein JL722_7104 [Aureococcus anophagefferens]|nr:hypothetical protein JL722_7104 [Aureococcus anophagefferens]